MRNSRCFWWVLIGKLAFTFPPHLHHPPTHKRIGQTEKSMLGKHEKISWLHEKPPESGRRKIKKKIKNKSFVTYTNGSFAFCWWSMEMSELRVSRSWVLHKSDLLSKQMEQVCVRTTRCPKIFPILGSVYKSVHVQRMFVLCDCECAG
jgi:hypothetical protein